MASAVLDSWGSPISEAARQRNRKRESRKKKRGIELSGRYVKSLLRHYRRNWYRVNLCSEPSCDLRAPSSTDSWFRAANEACRSKKQTLPDYRQRTTQERRVVQALVLIPDYEILWRQVKRCLAELRQQRTRLTQELGKIDHDRKKLQMNIKILTDKLAKVRNRCLEIGLSVTICRRVSLFIW